MNLRTRNQHLKCYLFVKNDFNALGFLVHSKGRSHRATEAVHVATAIRGGASLVHGLQMLEHVNRKSM